MTVLFTIYPCVKFGDSSAIVAVRAVADAPLMVPAVQEPGFTDFRPVCYQAPFVTVEAYLRDRRNGECRWMALWRYSPDRVPAHLLSAAYELARDFCAERGLAPYGAVIAE